MVNGIIQTDEHGKVKYNPQPHSREITTETTPAGNLSLPYAASYWDHLSEYSAIKDHFDYSGLWKEYHSMKHRDNNFNLEGDSALEMSYTIADKAPCEYVLPTQLNDQLGTSAYVLVKAKIHPLTYIIDELGTEATAAGGNVFPEGDDVYFDPIGGNFYDNPEYCENNCEKFTEGWCYYLFPLNPEADGGEGWSSHINRNAYYHVQILSLNTVGLNWNPLVPYPDGVSADYAQEEFPGNPHNPAPFPAIKKDKKDFEVPLYLPSSYIIEHPKRDKEKYYISAKREKIIVKDKDGQDKEGTKEDLWPNPQRAFHGLGPKP